MSEKIMFSQMTEEKLKGICGDETFLCKLATLKEAEDVVKLFSEKGIEISRDEVKELGVWLKNSVLSKREVSESELDETMGGISAKEATKVVTRGAGLSLGAVVRMICYAVGAMAASIPRGIVDGAVDAWYLYNED